MNSGKTFVINHPIYENKLLVHACLEGPEAGVYYRGKIYVQKSAEIILPDYVSKLATDLTIYITPFEEKVDEDNIIFPAYKTQKTEKGFKVFSSIPHTYDWMILGKRFDIDVEPDKKDIQIYGNGPYRWTERNLNT